MPSASPMLIFVLRIGTPAPDYALKNTLSDEDRRVRTAGRRALKNRSQAAENTLQ